ncbi:Biotin carboxyl carrier protein of acetyl-CoA carboxylase [Sporomusa carbonis]|uniref:acetyl-CoA carboxylase biotin carboxyl carrier protein n=1 Tax=Sporomusa carbonis TaxID=3076075 RepID=UPI003A677CB4
MLKIDEILEIIKTVNQSSINKFEFEQAGTRLTIVKDGSCSPQGPAECTRPDGNQSKPAPAAGGPGAVPQDQSAVTVVEAEDKWHKIVSPMIGTFYAAAEPGAKPFVQIGQKVKACTVVCVLEAMKLFNEIEAGIDGEIVEILVKDGEFVEYGQPLFLVKAE